MDLIDFQSIPESFKQTINAQSLGVHYKRFFGNSFYGRLGVDQRKVKANYSDSGFLFLPAEEAAFTVDTTNFSIAIGNQWQWENFTLGCDWIGLSQPFLRSFSNESVSNSPNSVYRDNVDRDKKLYGEELAFMALKFYLGATF